MARDNVTVTDLWKGAETGPGKRYRFRVWDPVAQEYSSRNVNTPEEGEEWARTKQAKFTLGIERSRGDQPTAKLTEIREKFVADLLRRGRAKAYVDDIDFTLKQVVDFGADDPMNSLFIDRVTMWLGQLKQQHPKRKKTTPLSPRSLNKKRTILATAMKWAVKMGLIPTELVSTRVAPVRDPAGGRRKAVFTVSEARQLVDPKHAADPFFISMHLLLYTGMRLDEVRALTWGVIDLVDGTIEVLQTEGARVKRDKERMIPLQRELRPVLERLKRDRKPTPEDHVVSVDEYGLKKEHTYTRFLSYLRRVGVPVHQDGDKRRGSRSPHSTRHTWMSLMLATGAPIAHVMKWTGHQGYEVVGGYDHRFPASAVKGWPPGELRLKVAPEMTDVEKLEQSVGALKFSLALPWLLKKPVEPWAVLHLDDELNFVPRPTSGQDPASDNQIIAPPSVPAGS